MAEIKRILETMNLKTPQETLFDRDAEAIARKLAEGGRSNKSSQIRRFYDDMLRYRAALHGKGPEQFAKALPFIRMLNARAAYAASRKSDSGTLVNGDFTEFLRAMLSRVEDQETLGNACTLFEAVIGFSPRN